MYEKGRNGRMNENSAGGCRGNGWLEKVYF
jgi:hypothetical protein